MRFRRVPLYVVWAVLSAASVVGLKIIEPDAEAAAYFQTPIYLGLTLIAFRLVPRKHSAWLPPLIGGSVTAALMVTWRLAS